MNKTNISWTDFTWNPITGCTAISEGCQNCYAKIVHERFNDTPFSEIVLHTNRLEEPMKRRKPCNIFIGSMTDLFHEKVPDEWLDEIFHIIMRTPHLTYQILTKRPERMKKYLQELDEDRICATKMMPYLSHTEIGGYTLTDWGGRSFEDDTEEFVGRKFPNVIFGVTAENQKEANVKIPILLSIPVKHRFVSIEPMVGKIDLTMLFPNEDEDVLHYINAMEGKDYQSGGYTKGNSLDWVIVGGESGTKSKVRKMDPNWVQRIYSDCKDNNVPFFFKQWGAFKPNDSFFFEKIQEWHKT